MERLLTVAAFGCAVLQQRLCPVLLPLPGAAGGMGSWRCRAERRSVPGQQGEVRELSASVGRKCWEGAKELAAITDRLCFLPGR